MPRTVATFEGLAKATPFLEGQMPQIGAQHHLYLAYDATDPTDSKTVNVLINTLGASVPPLPANPVNCNDLLSASAPALLNKYDTIRDVEVGGDNNTVDTTTRESARQGFSTEIIATSSSTITIEAVYEPKDQDGVVVDPSFQALIIAFLTKKAIWGVDLDKPVTEKGAAGLSGNFSVGFSQPKPVQGLVVVNFTLALASKAQWITTDTSEPDPQFVAEVDP